MGKHLKDNSGRCFGDGKGTGYRNPPGPQWKPGQSGNPSGKARSGCTSPEVGDREVLRLKIKSLLALQMEINGESLEYIDVILRNMAREAATGSKLAYKFLELWLELGGGVETSPADDLSEDEQIIIQDAARRRRRPRGARSSELGAKSDDEDAS